MVIFRVRFPVKEILLALSVLIALPGIYDRLATIDGLGGHVGYIGRLAILWGALLAAAYIRPAPDLDWQRDIARNRDRSSHYMIFPTLLTLMGYDPAASQARYGRPLTAPSNDPGTFNTLFNARLNREPNWLKVEREEIRQPPTSDGANAALPPGKTAS